METTYLFVIKCRTCCLCCDDYSCGPYKTNQDALSRIEGLKNNRENNHPIGEYRIVYYDGEILPDGRVIVKSRIFPQFFLVDDVGDLMLEDDSADKIPFDFIYKLKE